MIKSWTSNVVSSCNESTFCKSEIFCRQTVFVVMVPNKNYKQNSFGGGTIKYARVSCDMALSFGSTN